MSDDSPHQPDSAGRADRERQRYSVDDFGDDPLTDTGPIDAIAEPADPAPAASAEGVPEGASDRGTEPLFDEPLRAAPTATGAQESLFNEESEPAERPSFPPPARPRPERGGRDRPPRLSDDDDEPSDRRPLIAVAAVVAVLVVVAIVVAVVGGGSGGSGGDKAAGKSGGPVFAGASTSASATRPATSAKTTATTTRPSAPATTPVSTVAPKGVPLTVLNNTTVTGLATDAAKEFAGRGWDIGMIGNYTGAVSTTTVYYVASDAKQEQAAQTLAAQFPKVAKVAPRLADLPGNGLTVVIAPDWKN